MYYFYVNKKIIVLLLLLIGVTGFSQKALRKSYKKAESAFNSGDFANAWTAYRTTMKIDPLYKYAVVRAAICAHTLRYPTDSLKLLKATLMHSKETDALFFRAALAHSEKRFDEALDLLAEYGAVPSSQRYYVNEEVDLLFAHCTNAVKLTAEPVPARIRNMGPGINSKYPEYAPVIMPDESVLYFTSKRPSSQPSRNTDNQYFEEIYVTRKTNNGWSVPENAGYPLNTKTNDACVAISPDGGRLIIYRTAPDVVSGDLYICTATGNEKWSAPQLLGHEINTEYIETSACFSSDTSEIFFSSNRPGGMGGKDIYRIKKLPDGKWSKALNLGPTVNTAEDDDSPFLHPDGITLYFSSRGHNSMGGFDIFRTTWNAEEREFGEAVNLGYPINDVDDDIFFVMSADGKKGYYSSARSGGHGATDIYEIDTKPASDVIVKTGRAIVGQHFGKARITLFEKANGTLYGEYLSNPNTGRFVLVLQPGITYDAIIQAEGYSSRQILLDPTYLDENEQLKFILSNEEQDK